MWWWMYLDSASEALSPRPCAATLLQPDFARSALEKAGSCDVCRPIAYLDLKRLGKLLAAQVDRVVDEVSFLAPSDYCYQNISSLRSDTTVRSLLYLSKSRTIPPNISECYK